MIWHSILFLIDSIHKACFFVGDACDDGDASTGGDVIGDDCQCAGFEIVFGCTDASACNYNSAAEENDGSCVYPGDACDDLGLVLRCALSTGSAAVAAASASIRTILAAAEIIFAVGLGNGDEIIFESTMREDGII